MYNYYNKRKFTISVFLIILLAIGIGYAYLTSNLSISGNTNVSTNTWNIHFENITVKDGSVTATTMLSCVAFSLQAMLITTTSSPTLLGLGQ